MNTFIGAVGVILFIGGFVLMALKKNCIVNFRGYVPMIVAGAVVFIISMSFTIIPTGYTGVRIFLGQVNDKPANNGLCWKVPFVEEIKKVNNKQHDIDFYSEIWGETADRTAISYSGITVTYSISGDKSAWIYANVANYEDNLVSMALVSSAIKTASKTLQDVDATNRGKIEPLALSTIQESVDEKYGAGVVTINKVIIDNADFEESYNQAIAAKQQAQLQYEQQQINNQKNVEQAKAEAEAAIAKANGEAQAKIIEAEAEAKANEILAKSLSDDIFKQRFLDKWDGKLPLVSGDGETIFDLGALSAGQ